MMKGWQLSVNAAAAENQRMASEVPDKRQTEEDEVDCDQSNVKEHHTDSQNNGCREEGHVVALLELEMGQVHCDCCDQNEDSSDLQQCQHLCRMMMAAAITK